MFCLEFWGRHELITLKLQYVNTWVRIEVLDGLGGKKVNLSPVVRISRLIGRRGLNLSRGFSRHINLNSFHLKLNFNQYKFSLLVEVSNQVQCVTQNCVVLRR